MIRAVQLYTFLGYCDESALEKEILECGAGVWGDLEPLLARFHERGYVTHGIEISDERLTAAQKYCWKHGIDMDLRQGDMRQLPFVDSTMSFVFSYNAIFHMSKADVAIAIGEIKRVLKPNGLCFVNFLSVEDQGCGEGEERGRGEFVQMEAGEETIHSYYEDDEVETYMNGFEILYKEKRRLERLIEGERYGQGYIDYIAQKR